MTDDLYYRKMESTSTTDLVDMIRERDGHIAKIEKENAELKSIADFQTSSNMDRYFQLKRSKEQLTKAKELLKRLLEEERDNVFWEMNGADKSSYFQVVKQAEQFLKELNK